MIYRLLLYMYYTTTCPYFTTH